MKKLVCIMVMVTMICNVFALSVMGAGEQKEKDLRGVICQYSFDDDKLPAIQGGASIVNDKARGKVMSLKRGSSSSIAYFTFDRPIEKGKLLISYDIKLNTEKMNAYAYISEEPVSALTADTEASRHGSYVWMTNGVFTFFLDTEWTATSTTGPELMYPVANQWYHFDAWYDLDTRMVQYYVDGELFGQTRLIKDYNKISQYIHAVAGNGCEQQFDNFVAVAFDGGGYNLSDYPFIKGAPDGIENKNAVWLKIPESGHIFFSKDRNITLSPGIREGIGQDFKGKLQLKIYDEDGKSYIYENAVELNENEQKIVDFEINVPMYGFYEVEVTNFDEAGNNYGAFKTRFSVLAYVDKPNPAIGFTDHNGHGRGFGSERLETAIKAGAGTIREDTAWDDWQKSKDVEPKVPNNYKKQTLDILDDLGIDMYILNQGGNSAVTGSAFPREREHIEGFKKYSRALYEYTKDMNIDYEFFNEFNFSFKPGNSHGVTYQDYVNLAKEVYPLAKEVNPDADFYVMTGLRHDDVDIRAFYEECFKSGIGEYCDGVSFHPYNSARTPEDKQAIADIDDLLAIVDKYCEDDKKLVFSEYGWSVSFDTTEDDQANYMLRASALHAHKVDKILWYNLSTKTMENMSEYEIGFGFIRGWARTDIPHEAKPAFAAFANYNRLMTNMEKLGEIEHSNENVYLHLFKNERGTQTLMAWVEKGTEAVALKTANESVTVYDRYGTESVLHAKNGVLNLQLTEAPIYIEAPTLDHITEAGINYSINEAEIETVNNDKVRITGVIPNSDAELKVEVSDNMEVESITTDKNGQLTLTVKTGNMGRSKEAITILLTDKATGNKIYEHKVKVKYNESVSAKANVRYYRNSRWQIAVEVEGKNETNRVTGKIHIEKPEGIKLSDSKAVFNNLLSGEKRNFFINIPPELTGKELNVEGYAELSNGEKIPFSAQTFFAGIVKNNIPPVADGKISLKEYKTSAPLNINQASMVKNMADWDGEEDVSGIAYLNYDEDYFYFVAKVADNIEGATEEGQKIWSNDSVQFSFVDKVDLNKPITEFGIGKDNSGKSVIWRYTFLGEKDIPEGESMNTYFEEDCKFAIEREGNYTIYEARIPWIDIFGKDSPKFNRRSVGFSMLINDNDGAGRRGWIEFCPGIGAGKDSSAFTTLLAID